MNLFELISLVCDALRPAAEEGASKWTLAGESMDLFEFRVLVRRVLTPGRVGGWQAKILSWQFALATPAQQAACVRAVRADIRALQERADAPAEKARTE
jgi:hypothetical protein